MTERNDRDEALSKREFAAELNVTTRTVNRWIANGMVRAERIGGPAGRIRIRRSEIGRVTAEAKPSA